MSKFKLNDYIPTTDPLWTDEKMELSKPKSDLNKSFLSNVAYGYDKLIRNDLDSRGSDKEEIQHDFISNSLRLIIPERYDIISKSESTDNTYGEYLLPILGDDTKQMDITILDMKYNRPVLCISSKFPNASYMKNSPNYKNDLCGEALRLYESNPDMPLFAFYIMMSRIPVFEKGKKITRFDNLSNVADSYDDIARVIVNKYKFLKGFGLMILDDNVVNENIGEIKTLEIFKQLHQKPFELDFTPGKTYENIIYNDFDKFINMILGYIKEYEEKMENQVI